MSTSRPIASRRWDDATYANAADRYLEICEAAKYIKSHLPEELRSPHIGIICGSGLSDIGEKVEDAVSLTYNEIPYFPESTVLGHHNRMVVGKLNGSVVLCLMGRFHFYEGHSQWNCVFPVHVMKEMMITDLIITNAAGGIDPSFNVGDVMVIEDHISFLSQAGLSPLRGQNIDAFGTRFPPMNHPYCMNSFSNVVEAAEEAGVDIHKIRRGVYIGLGGPSFETRSELKFLSIIGGSAVGMSTTNEVIIAAHAGLKVLALSLITNTINFSISPDQESTPSHAEVLQAAAEMAPNMIAIVTNLIPKLHRSCV